MGRGPLEGVQVVDFSQAGVGPWAGLLLGQLGADVIKVEAPAGDLIHWVRPTQNGLSTTYAVLNLNKRGIILDLKMEQDRAAALGLVAKADVVIENFRPGVVERLGIDYETVRKCNPQLVYCSVTGFGRTGPMKDVGCTDQHVQAFSGYWSLNGEPGSHGQNMRYYAHHDLNTSMVATQAILTALYVREETGEGQRVETSMLEAAFALQQVRLSEFFATGHQPQRLGSAISYCVPDQAFRCADGKYLAVTASSDAEWQALCRVLGIAEIAGEPRFATNPLRVEHRDQLIPLLEERFASRPAPWWNQRLAAAGVPCGPFLDFEQQRNHAHFRENELLVSVEKAPWGTLTAGGLPWHFQATPGRVSPPPFPGEHNRQVLEERNLTATDRPGPWKLPPRG